MNEVLEFYFTGLGVIASIVCVGSLAFYPKQTAEALTLVLKAFDRAIRRWAEK